MADIIPYINNTETIPATGTQAIPGYQIVHFTVTDPSNMQLLINKIQQWYSARDEVLLVDQGITGAGLGFVVMEWNGCAADQLFLSILEHDEFVDDFSVYTRDDDEED